MKKTLFKRLVLCASTLGLSVQSTYATQDVLITSASSVVRRSLSISMRRISSVFPSQFSTAGKISPLITTRCYSDFNHSSNESSGHSFDRVKDYNCWSPDNDVVKDILDKILLCETFLSQGGRYLKETKDMVKILRRVDNSNQTHSSETGAVAYNNLQQSLSRTPSDEPPNKIQSKKNAVIIPVNQNDSSGLSRTKSGLKGELLKQERDPFNYSGSEEFLENEKTDTADDNNQDLAKKVRMIQEDFENRIISACKSPQKVNREDLRRLLDLYGALANKVKDGITKVLNGQIDTSKSSSFRAVSEHAQSKKSNISGYREIYSRLCNTFDQDVMVVVYRVLHAMMKENAQMLTHMNSKNNESWSMQDYISFIVLGANPLYPLTADEVKLIMDLYAVNSNIPKDAISKVLSGDTDTSKSAVYRAVLSHAQSVENIEVYRNIYARIIKSLNEQAMPIIYRMIKNDLYKGDAPQSTNLLSTALPSRSNSSYSNSTASLDQSPNNDYRANAQFYSPDNNVSINKPRSENIPEEAIQSRDGKYTITKREQARLNRIYTLLPEFHGKSIAMVLSGETKNTAVPAWRAVHGAIEQISQEAIQEGDYTPIDLNYFRKLYWASLRVTGTTGVRGRKGRSRIDQPSTQDSELNDYLSSLESEMAKKRKLSPKKAKASVSKAPTSKKENGTKSKYNKSK